MEDLVVAVGPDGSKPVSEPAVESGALPAHLRVVDLQGRTVAAPLGVSGVPDEDRPAACVRGERCVKAAVARACPRVHRPSLRRIDGDVSIRSKELRVGGRAHAAGGTREVRDPLRRRFRSAPRLDFGRFAGTDAADELDHAAERRIPPQVGRSSFDDLDAFQGELRNASPVDPPSEGIVQREGVVEDERAARSGSAQPAQAHALGRRVRGPAARPPEKGEPGNPPERVVENRGRRLDELTAGHHAHRSGRSGDRARRSGSRHRDLFGHALRKHDRDRRRRHGFHAGFAASAPGLESPDREGGTTGNVQGERAVGSRRRRGASGRRDGDDPGGRDGRAPRIADVPRYPLGESRSGPEPSQKREDDSRAHRRRESKTFAGLDIRGRSRTGKSSGSASSCSRSPPSASPAGSAEGSPMSTRSASGRASCIRAEPWCRK